MKRKISALLILFAAAFVLVSALGVAHAEETKMVGVIAKIELAADGKSANVALTDNKTGEEVKVVVVDDLTLDKFKDHRIVDGDEVRVKYEEKDGKKVATYFRKTAGC